MFIENINVLKCIHETCDDPNVSYGLNVRNVSYEQEVTPEMPYMSLLFAAMNDCVDVVRYILSVDPGLFSDAVIYSRKNGKLLKYLAAWANTDEDRRYVLHHAIVYHDMPAFNCIMSRGVDVNMSKGEPLLTSIRENNYEAFMSLISHGAKINIRNHFPVVTAAGFGRLDMLKHLVACGADMRVRNDEPLRVAMLYDHANVIEYLASSGIDSHTVKRFTRKYLRVARVTQRNQAGPSSQHTHESRE